MWVGDDAAAVVALSRVMTPAARRDLSGRRNRNRWWCGCGCGCGWECGVRFGDRHLFFFCLPSLVLRQAGRQAEE